MKNNLFIVISFAICILLLPLISWAASPANLTTDIVWTDSGGTGFQAAFGGVGDIEIAFNNARRQEEIQFGFATNAIPDLVMPTQTVWDGLSDDAKALYLINDERVARAGIVSGVLGLPLAGIEKNIDDIAAYYAQFLHDNDATGHNADGAGGAFNRIDNDPEIGNAKGCHEFLPRSENLAYFATTASSIPLPIERSVYNFVYDDSSSLWGHREAVLLQNTALNGTTSFANNNGSAEHEGFLGVHHISSADYAPFSTFPSNFGSVVVMIIFDPVSDANATARDCNYLVTLDTDEIFGAPVATYTLDIDGDGTAKPLTDGLLVLRHLFGFTGNALISGAVDTNATRTNAAEIQSFIQEGVDNATLDIDGNGQVEPLTDGLLVLRYLFNFSGNSLINNAIGNGATRNNASDIEAYLLSKIP